MQCIYPIFGFWPDTDPHQNAQDPPNWAKDERGATAPKKKRILFKDGGSLEPRGEQSVRADVQPIILIWQKNREKWKQIQPISQAVLRLFAAFN